MPRFVQYAPVLLFTLWFAVAAGAVEIAADTPAQRATVTIPGAAVRSGPGTSYYLTDTLPEQTDVEVYRRQPDGWCAIRPPADSFSWVFSQNVRLVDEEVAEITKDDVASRVGSRLSGQRDVVQVRLKQGEKVTILGRDERDGGLWYKIAPPAGEFRWIRAEEIGLARAVGERKPRMTDVAPASLEEPIDAPPLANAAASMTSPTNSAGSKTASDQWTAAKSVPPPLADITPIGAAKPSATSTELAEHLQQLELQLSRMVAESPTTWNIAPLEQAAEQLLSRADTVADREAVKVTLAKIDRFASIQRRYASGPMAAPARQLGAMAPGPMTAAATPGAVGETSNDPTASYDAVGILRPVVSRRPGAPQFALVNAQGQVITFVTPAPDVNLQSYIGQRVGVSGSRGYIPEFRRAHVTAGRVSPLDQRMLR
jgi:uncharacterized protein YgiM (DUF1202 family)